MSLEHTQTTDVIADTLRRYAQNILVVVFGLLPIFFVPTAYAPFEYSKVFFVLAGVMSALVLYSLSILRSGKISIGFSYTLVAMWAVALVAFVSSLLSGDIRDSLVGDVLSVHSTVFVGILALVMSVWAFIGAEKVSVMRLYMLLAASTIVLVLFHVARLIVGADTLSLGVFQSSIATPVGSWNDLALFLGLSILLSLVTMEQLPLTKQGRILFTIVTVVALFMLGVINFFTVWLILGLVSLVMIVYSLGKDRLSGSQLSLVSGRVAGPSSLMLSLIVFAVSVLFIIGGAALGGYISKFTNISYIEVRPSLQATADIARNVYQENAFLGIGPNKFADAWRLHKDASINATVFWNTDFNAGNGYITTFFITAGVLGGIVWLLFLGTFLISGVRILLTASDSDRMWYFIGVSSFVSAVYIWGMSLIYVPGAVVLILGALCTGVTIAAAQALRGKTASIYSIISNRRTGFIMTLAVIVVIIGSVATLYGVGRDYAAVYTFNGAESAFANGADIETVKTRIADAYALSSSDVYARRIAEYEFILLNSMLGIQNPTSEDQRRFETAVVNGVNAAERAQGGDASEANNWAVQGGIYSLLMSANIDGVYDRAKDSLTKARDLNPKNPIVYLNLAELEGRAGNYDAAREQVQTAINLKPNFTDAFFYLSQLDIVTGNVEGAIASARSIVALEPQNAARYYQLGVLETSRQNIEGAIEAFERAIELDTNYANARYLLALAYDEEGRATDARAQLEKVLELNPGNPDVLALIASIDTHGSIKTETTASSTSEARVIGESQTVSEDNGAVTTNEAPDSPLVSPVNTVPATGGAEGSGESVSPQDALPSEAMNQ